MCYRRKYIYLFTYYSGVYSPGITGGQNEGQKGVRIPVWNLPAVIRTMNVSTRTIGSEQALRVATDQVNLPWRRGVVRKHYEWFQCQRLANWSWGYQMPVNWNLRNCFVVYRSQTPSRTLGYRLQELHVIVNKHKYNKWTRQIPQRKIQQNLTHHWPVHFLIAMEPDITVFTKSATGPNWAPLTCNFRSLHHCSLPAYITSLRLSELWMSLYKFAPIPQPRRTQAVLHAVHLPFPPRWKISSLLG